MSRDEHRTAQTREVECTRIVRNEVMKQGWVVVVICHKNISSRHFQDEILSLDNELLYKESRDMGSTPDHAWRTGKIGVFLQPTGWFGYISSKR